MNIYPQYDDELDIPFRSIEELIDEKSCIFGFDISFIFRADRKDTFEKSYICHPVVHWTNLEYFVYTGGSSYTSDECDKITPIILEIIDNTEHILNSIRIKRCDGSFIIEYNLSGGGDQTSSISLPEDETPEINFTFSRDIENIILSFYGNYFANYMIYHILN